VEKGCDIGEYAHVIAKTVEVSFLESMVAIACDVVMHEGESCH